MLAKFTSCHPASIIASLVVALGIAGPSVAQDSAPSPPRVPAVRALWAFWDACALPEGEMVGWWSPECPVPPSCCRSSPRRSSS